MTTAKMAAAGLACLLLVAAGVRTEDKGPQEKQEKWIQLFNGKDLTGWLAQGGPASVEDGALVSRDAADLFYRAGWEEFVLECELKSKAGMSPWAAVSLAQPTPGRGNLKVLVIFHGDGDVHVHLDNERVAATGGGKIDLSDWTKVTFELTTTTLKVSSDRGVLVTADISACRPLKGGLLFYSNEPGLVSYMRNARVKVLR